MYLFFISSTRKRKFGGCGILSKVIEMVRECLSSSSFRETNMVGRGELFRGASKMKTITKIPGIS